MPLTVAHEQESSATAPQTDCTVPRAAFDLECYSQGSRCRDLPSVEKNCFCAQLFEAEVGRSAQRTRSMPDAGGNSHALPRLEPDLPATLEIDGKASAHDDEKLIRGWMRVPPVGLLEHGKSQAAIVDLADDHISIRLRDRGAFLREIDDLERREFHGFVYIVLYH
jgi:hypothetical protein